MRRFILLLPHPFPPWNPLAILVHMDLFRIYYVHFARSERFQRSSIFDRKRNLWKYPCWLNCKISLYDRTRARWLRRCSIFILSEQFTSVFLHNFREIYLMSSNGIRDFSSLRRSLIALLFSCVFVYIPWAFLCFSNHYFGLDVAPVLINACIPCRTLTQNFTSIDDLPSIGRSLLMMLQYMSTVVCFSSQNIAQKMLHLIIFWRRLSHFRAELSWAVYHIFERSWANPSAQLCSAPLNSAQ